MKLQDQHLFSLINTIRKKDRFYFFISDKKNYIFDGISYSFFEIENTVAIMLNFGNVSFRQSPKRSYHGRFV